MVRSVTSKKNLSCDEVRVGTDIVKTITPQEHVSSEFVEHLRASGASDELLTAATAAVEA